RSMILGMSSLDEEAAVANAFLREALDDHVRGSLRPLAEYQSRYPGFETAVGREYSALEIRLSLRSEAPGRQGPAAPNGQSPVGHHVTPRTLRDVLEGPTGGDVM